MAKCKVIKILSSDEIIDSAGFVMSCGLTITEDFVGDDVDDHIEECDENVKEKGDKNEINTRTTK